MAVTPDPAINRYFSLDGQYPATVQMVLEPLLLFDSVFVENRPVDQLVAPPFSYRSAFLKSWYEDRLEAPGVDEIAINKENAIRASAVAAEQSLIDGLNKTLQETEAALKDPVAAGLVEVDLEAGQMKWEEGQAKQIDGEYELSPWHKIGPFRAGSPDEAHAKVFIDEAAVDLKKQYGD